MLKGLEGVRTHEHREWLPIVENDQDMTRLVGVVRGVLDEHPAGALASCCAATGSTPGAPICRRPSGTSRFSSSCWRSLGEKLSAVSRQLSATALLPTER